jgi:molybdate transport system substrate-binding protein
MLKKVLLTAIIAFGFIGCGKDDKDTNNQVNSSENKKELLFYCGITMVKPISEIAKIIEEKHNCKIKITQGGSKDLYKSLKSSQIGDLYLPGSQSYRIKNLKDGFLKDGVYVGYNQAGLIVQKGNPKNIKADLNELTNENYNVILCNPDSGSIGKHTKSILSKISRDLYQNAYSNTVALTTDSRNLNKAIKNKDADVVVNWLATAYFEENKNYVSILKLNSKVAPKKELIINLLSFSKHPQIAKDFMKFASSKEGKEIFYKYGFLDKKQLKEQAKWYK